MKLHTGKRFRHYIDALMHMHWWRVGREGPPLQIPGGPHIRTWLGTITPSAWSKRLRSACSSWGGWKGINSHRMCLQTSTAVPSKASSWMAVQSGTPERGNACRGKSKQLSRLSAPHFHPSVIFFSVVSISRPPASWRTPHTLDTACSAGPHQTDWGQYGQEPTD